ncbi:hypothetical protein SPRG_19793, partial [Saprolegnia parasitica CBS 223.65]
MVQMRARELDDGLALGLVKGREADGAGFVGVDAMRLVERVVEHTLHGAEVEHVAGHAEERLEERVEGVKGWRERLVELELLVRVVEALSVDGHELSKKGLEDADTLLDDKDAVAVVHAARKRHLHDAAQHRRKRVGLHLQLAVNPERIELLPESVVRRIALLDEPPPARDGAIGGHRVERVHRGVLDDLSRAWVHLRRLEEGGLVVREASRRRLLLARDGVVEVNELVREATLDRGSDGWHGK